MIRTADLTPRQKKITLILMSLLALYLLVGFLGLPFIVRPILEKQAAGAVRRQVSVESVRVNAADYRKLANQRAFSAKNYLLETGQVERERVFIVEPQSKARAEEQVGGAGQVVFSLK
ncbi:MAG TPA: hypothetical protein VLT88_11635 [Desulfosarcina sp.]|nr:hypothetical protein [Desulfosarcina sp.]